MAAKNVSELREKRRLQRACRPRFHWDIPHLLNLPSVQWNLATISNKCRSRGHDPTIFPPTPAPKWLLALLQ
jgi:hypothetical protein